MKPLTKKIILYTLGAIAGAVGGYLYAVNVGCKTGTCMITSSPLNSTIYFGVLGLLVISIFMPSKSKA
ncbi:MAG TPA: hypothetical protein PLP23_06815 [Panacibacter sp.]|nr:hypothetical protein [Panacibacter sp.]